jgi:hypothetical protein
MKALAPTNQKLLPRLKVFEQKVKCQGQKSEDQGHGLARRNTHVKYESPSTYLSNIMTKVQVFE